MVAVSSFYHHASFWVVTEPSGMVPKLSQEVSTHVVSFGRVSECAEDVGGGSVPSSVPGAQTTLEAAESFLLMRGKLFGGR